MRHALRQVVRDRWSSALIVGVLALGIAANIAVFSLLNAIVLRPLPFTRPETLVHVTARDRSQLNSPGCLSYEHFEFFQSNDRDFSGLAGYANESFNLAGRGNPVTLQGARVSSNFFRVLGVQPSMGRAFSVSSEKEPGKQSALVSHRLWQERLEGKPLTENTTLTLNSRVFTVIGVLPPSFRFGLLGLRADIWTEDLTAISSLTREQIQAGSCYINSVARMRPGSNIATAAAGVRVLQSRFVQQHAGLGDADPGREIEVMDLHEKVSGGSKSLLRTLCLAVGILLFIACGNVSSLFLARAIERQKDVAITLALGATPLRVVGQLLAESLFLATAAGGLGLMLSIAAGRLVYASLTGVMAGLPNEPPPVDGRVLAFALFTSILVAALCGVLPALQFVNPDLNNWLRGSRGSTSGRGARMGRSSLVVGQMGLSILLLIVAGILVDSFVRLLMQPVGFDPHGVVAATVSLSPAKYAKREEIVGFYQRTLEGMRSIPGVKETAIASALPANESMLAHYRAEGEPPLPLARRRIAAIQSLTASYLRVMSIPLIRGRFFNDRDGQGRRSVAVVNRVFARTAFGGQNPIGKRIWLGADPVPWEIVGVIGDVRNAGLAAPAQAEVDFPFEQLPWAQMNLLARVSDDAAFGQSVVRAQVAKVDVEQPLSDVRTMEGLLADTRSQPRVIMGAVTFFAAVAFVLALVGLCSVVSYSAARRDREFGIRLALGATRRDLVLSILTGSSRLALTGALLGLIAALILVRYETTLAAEPGQFRSLAFIAAPIAFFICAQLASLIPALRFTRLNPAEILRRQ